MKKNYWWICSIIFFVMVFFIESRSNFFLFAEPDGEESHHVVSQVHKINLGKINLKDAEVIGDLPLLSEYFTCKAIISNNENECNNLEPWKELVKQCKTDYYEYHEFLGRLVLEKTLSSKAPYIWVSLFKRDKKDLEAYSRAIIKNDASECEFLREKKARDNCKAMVSGDLKLCNNNTACENKVLYVKALQSGDITKCDKMIGPNKNCVKDMCRGCLSRDMESCEKGNDYQKFIRKHAPKN